ncbi:MAG: hypothetical protein OHK0044_28810 [Burkholderiaceae bacterium]
MTVGGLTVGIKLTLDDKEMAGTLAISRDRLRAFAAEMRRAADAGTSAFSTTRTALKSISTQLAEARNALIGYFSVMQAARGAQAVLEAASSVQQLSARLKIATQSAADYARAQAGVIDIANRYGASVDETARAFARINPVIRQLGGGTAETLRMLDGLAASLKLSGASAAETSAVLTQFAQAMGSGKVGGDELRSMMEQAEPLMRAVAAQMGKTTGELRQMAEQGMLTSAAFGNALLPAVEKISAQAAQVPLGLTQSMQVLRNSLSQAFGREFEQQGTKVSEAIRSLAGHAETAARAVRVLADALAVLAEKAAIVLSGAAIGGLLMAAGSAAGAVAALASAVRGLTAAFAAFNTVAAGLVLGAVMQKLEGLSRFGKAGLLGAVFFGAYEITDWIIEVTNARAALGDLLTPVFELVDKLRGIDRKAEAAAAEAAAAAAVARIKAATREAPKRLADPSAFSRLTQDLAYETRLRAKHKQELLDLEQAYQDKLATLKAEGERKALTREYQEARRELLLKHKDEMAGILSRKAAAVTRLPESKRAFDADIKALQDALKTQSDIIETALAARLIGQETYYTARAAIARRGLAAEREMLQRELAAQQDLIARLSRVEPKDANQGEEIAGKLADARNKAADLRAELDALDGREVAAKFRLDVDREEARRQIRDAIEEARLEIASAQGADTPEMRRAAVERALRDTAARLAQDAEGARLAEKLIDVRAAQADLDALQARWQQALERMRAAQENASALLESGAIGPFAARARIESAAREAAAELEALLAPMQDAMARFLPAEQVAARTQALRTALAQVRSDADALGGLWTRLGESFGNALDAMLRGAATWRDALQAMFADIAAAFQRELIIRPVQEWVAAQARLLAARLGFAQQEVAAQAAASRAIVAARQQEAAATVSAEAAKAGAGAASSQAGIPVVGPGLAMAAMAAMVAAVMALLTRVRRFAVGGTVPGAGSADTVPALLTPGEFVIRRDVARRIGYDVLAAINGGLAPRHAIAGRLAFAAGGMVPAAASAPAVHQSVRIVNAIDPALAADWLGSAAGERVVLNLISRNAPAVRSILAGP